VVERLEAEVARLAEPAELDRVLLLDAVGCLRIGEVGDHVEQALRLVLDRGQLGLEALELRLHALQLLELLRRRLPLQLAAGAELLDSR
jgi:hypothetical protein